MENWLIFVGLILIVGASICFYFVKERRNRKEAQIGRDKERFRKAVEPLLGEDENSQVVYAHWEERESYGRTVRVTYYRYAVIYRDQTLCVVPLSIDKKSRQIQMGHPSFYSLENLGKVTVSAERKDGAVKHMKIWLDSKQGNTMFQFYVDAENLRKTRWYPVNLAQWEECADFEGFITSLAQSVDAENPGVDDLIAANNNAGLGIIGAFVSILGAVFALFLPPAGIVFALPGLLLSIVSKGKGSKSKAPLIVSIVCAIWCILFLWVYFV